LIEIVEGYQHEQKAPEKKMKKERKEIEAGPVQKGEKRWSLDGGAMFDEMMDNLSIKYLLNKLAVKPQAV